MKEAAEGSRENLSAVANLILSLESRRQKIELAKARRKQRRATMKVHLSPEIDYERQASQTERPGRFSGYWSKFASMYAPGMFTPEELLAVLPITYPYLDVGDATRCDVERVSECMSHAIATYGAEESE